METGGGGGGGETDSVRQKSSEQNKQGIKKRRLNDLEGSEEPRRLE